MTDPTEAQTERQHHRRQNGRYAEVFPCQICRRSAGLHYCSDRRTNTVDAAGNQWADSAIQLCQRCAARLNALPDAEAYAIASGQTPAPWLKTKESA